MYSSPRDSTTVATPSTVAPLTRGLIFHVSGFSDGVTLSVERDMVTKSTRKKQQNYLERSNDK